MAWLLSGTENKCIRLKKRTPKLPLKTQKNFRNPKNLPISLSLVCRLKSRSPNKPYAISIIIDFGWGIIVQPGVHAGHFVPHELLIIELLIIARCFYSIL
jgi:hypothetical protein